MLVLGDVLLTAAGQELRCWSIASVLKAQYDTAMTATIALPPGFNVTGVVHPPTYLNKARLCLCKGCAKAVQRLC
jgi:hypothetical protein